MTQGAERKEASDNGAESEPRGLACPRCECRHLPVVYTRRTIGNRIMRRRECRHCGRRITTYEHSLD